MRILHDARNLIQTLQWQFGIGVEEPKDFPARGVRSCIHLVGTTSLALNKLIAETCSEVSRAIGTFTIGDDNLGSRRSLAQVREKSPYQRRLIENRNND
jgi:hypothetical protein